MQKYVRVKEWETEQLDFKMKLDSNREEDAKDIAALANRLGGDLVIGITEKDDRAEAFHLMEDSRLQKAIELLNRSLGRIRPEAFRTSPKIQPVRIDQSGSVIVISVPPSPELVCVQSDDGSRLQFPVRVDRHTQFFSYEEVMKNSVSSARGKYLRLRSMMRGLGPKPPVRFSSPIILQFLPAVQPLPLSEGRHGNLEELEVDRLTVDLIMGNPNANGYVTIPLDLVRTMWVDHRRGFGNTPLLCLALDARLFWNGAYWIVET